MFSQLHHLVLRNFKVFLKDPKRIFFTFMSPMIVFACFLLFARTIYINQLPKMVPQIIKDQYADVSLMIGLLSTTAFTSAISLSSVMVTDAENKILNDLYITPVRPGIVRWSYLIFNIILNIIITTLMFLISIFWLLGDKTYSIEYTNMSGELVKEITITPLKGLYIWLIIVVGCIVNSTIFVFLLSYISNSGAFSAISAALSTVAGFLIGAFIPLQTFPRAVSEFSSLIPATHISNLIRHFSLEDLGIAGATNVSDAEFNILFGQDIKWWVSLAYVGAWTVIMVAANFLVKTNKKRK